MFVSGSRHDLGATILVVLWTVVVLVLTSSHPIEGIVITVNYYYISRINYRCRFFNLRLKVVFHRNYIGGKKTQPQRAIKTGDVGLRRTIFNGVYRDLNLFVGNMPVYFKISSNESIWNLYFKVSIPADNEIHSRSTSLYYQNVGFFRRLTPVGPNN